MSKTYDKLRRRDTLRHTPAEAAIAAAMAAVEALPGDSRLTYAGSKLMEAQDAVADYVDGVHSDPPCGLMAINPSILGAAADAEIAAIRAERDALRAGCERYKEEMLTYFGKAAEHAGRIAALTREAEAALAAPDEAEVERVAEAIAECIGNPGEGYNWRPEARAAIAAFMAGRKERAG